LADVGTKHGPNRRANYERVHDTVIQQFLRGGFVLSEDLRFEEVAGRGYLVLRGEVRCSGGIVLEVEKRIKILDGDGPYAMVQTVQYRYHAYSSGRGNLFRYCGPHDDRPYHHVHRYDVFNTWSEASIEEITDEDEIPTLGEVLGELREMYYSSDEF
jgi:hypothetical protein